MAGWLHGVFVGERLFVFPLCGFSLSLFCNYWFCEHMRAPRGRCASAMHSRKRVYLNGICIRVFTLLDVIATHLQSTT